MFFLFGFLGSCNNEEIKNDSKDDITTRSSKLVIGKVINGEYVITANHDTIKSQLTSFINSSGNSFGPVESIEIVQYNDTYYLSGKGDNHSTAVRLQLSNDEFIEVAGGGSCTCSGCTSTGPESAHECIARTDVPGGCYCTDCTRGECKKTTSALKAGETIFSIQ